AIFYTLFVQDIPGSEDADPDTSDAIAVFHGPRRPPYVPGDVVKVRGQVTEFYGLTEIDDSGLQIELLSTGQPLPAAIDLIPSNAGDPSYFESLEAMRVSMPAAVVVGPTFSGCGFAVAAGTRPRRFLRRELTDEISEIMPVLHNSDVSCGDFPQVMVGDVIRGLEGPLTYHFDQFKIVQQSTDDLAVSSAAVSAPPPPPEAGENQASIGSFNLHDYFDVVNQSGSPDEPVPSKEEVQVKQIKLARTISESLGCPTLLAVQEVESEALLRALAERLQAACGFTYSAVHRESSDARGIDLGLLADSRRIQVVSATSEQRCTPVSTDVPKTGTSCPTAQYPLFSRPPLQVDLLLDNMPYTVVVVHLKSKREGEQETEARRLAQAAAVAKLAQVRLDSNPEAHLVVLGDFNDYELSRTIDVLTSDNVGLINTATEIPLEQRYTYNFGGVLQMLDTIIVSPAVLTQVMSVNVVHVNADFPAGWAADVNTVFRSSDHDVPYVVVRTGDVDPAVAPTTTSTAEVPGEGSVVAPTAIQPAPLTPSDSAAGSQSPWVFGAIGALVGILGGAVLRTWRRHSRD
ncbi:MAG TPA: hypothetical protein VE553_02900, partial [Candidatus Binatia bacterium]|nr:hypothetical protein [Candidatus Binatia bacterium]